MKTVLVDVDDVIANCADTVRAFTQRLLHKELPPVSEWSSWNFIQAMQLGKSDAALFTHAANNFDWAHEIRLLPGAVEGVERLRSVAEVVFCTAPWIGNKTWCHHRMSLLSENFPGVEVVQTHSKHRVLGDYLIDDKAETILKGGRWRGLLWTQPWNVAAKGVLRVNNWDEVLEEVGQ